MDPRRGGRPSSSPDAAAAARAKICVVGETFNLNPNGAFSNRI